MRARAIPVTLLVLAIATVAPAQQIEVTPFVGFAATDVAQEESSRHYHGHDTPELRFDESIDVDEDSIYGLSLALGLTRHTQIELLYSQQRTSYRDTTDREDRRFDLDLDYTHVGIAYQWTLDRVEPFVVASLGTTRVASDLAPADDVFSVSGGGGIKLMLNDRLGLRFAGRVFVSAIDEDDPLLCPVATCGGEGEEALAQFDLSAGLVLRFGQPQRPTGIVRGARTSR